MELQTEQREHYRDHQEEREKPISGRERERHSTKRRKDTLKDATKELATVVEEVGSQ